MRRTRSIPERERQFRDAGPLTRRHTGAVCGDDDSPLCVWDSARPALPEDEILGPFRVQPRGAASRAARVRLARTPPQK